VQTATLTFTAYNIAFGNMVAEGSFNVRLVRYWAFVSARQTSLNIGKLYLSLVRSQAAVPGGRISNSTTSPSATVGGNFMRPYNFTILLLILVGSCRPKTNIVDEPKTVLPSAFYDKNLQVSTEDTVRYSYTSRERYPSETFNGKNGYCTFRNDSLFFHFSDGIMGSSYLTIFVTKDSSKAFFGKSDCTSNTVYKNIAYKLTLNNKDFALGDTILADIFFKAVAYKDNRQYFKNDTATVAGKIKLKIRDANFDFDHLNEENSQAEFYELLQQRPDTITKLNLYGSGFIRIPEVINQFKNLQELSLENNDLSKADFSVLLELKKLKSLSLQNCRLNKVPQQLFQLKGLEILNLYWNNLTDIPDELYSLTTLKDLNIGYNNLNSLSPKISNLIYLESLETSATEIKSYPDAMANLKNIKELYPRDTMKYIPASLKKYAWGCDYY
jgi:Leucine-rich repeat (LRR) protein